jgi:hypothetical protein
MLNTVEELVSLARFALEQEDRYILGCSIATGGKGGILRIENERYFQFVVMRSLLSRFDVVAERSLHDLIILDHGSVSVIIEMKCWRNDRSEFDSFRADIKKLQAAKGSAAYMLMFWRDVASRLEQNLAYLKEHVKELGTVSEVQNFTTKNANGDDAIFVVAGWQLR